MNKIFMFYGKLADILQQNSLNQGSYPRR